MIQWKMRNKRICQDRHGNKSFRILATFQNDPSELVDVRLHTPRRLSSDHKPAWLSLEWLTDVSDMGIFMLGWISFLHSMASAPVSQALQIGVVVGRLTPGLLECCGELQVREWWDLCFREVK